MRWNKKDLVRIIGSRVGIPDTVVCQVIDAAVEEISDILSKGGEFTIRGFGTFGVTKRAEKVGQDIRKGTPVNIPAHYSPCFKAGKTLKERVK